MGRETRAWMSKNQSKAGMGIAYGQRKREQDGEKSVQSWHRTAYGQRKQTKGARKSVQNRHKSNKMADKRK